MGIDIDGFADYLYERELAEHTIDTYKHSVALYASRCGELSKAGMMAFKRHVIESMKPKSAANRITAMNQYCIYAGRRDCMVKNVKTPKRTMAENVIRRDEFEALLEGLRKDQRMRDYWMVQMMGKTGARVSELVQFRVSDIRKSEVTLFTKGKVRTILIPDSVCTNSLEWFEAQESEWAFPSRDDKSKHMTTRGVDSRLKWMAKKYGIRKEAMHPHSFRHMFAVEFLKHNGNIALLADIMGHESVNTTAIYLTLSKREQRSILNDAMM